MVRMPRPARRVLVPSTVAVLLLAACHGGATATPPPSTTSTSGGASATTQPTPSGSTTVPIQTSGPRTVLSAVGLNVRSAPSKTGAVVGTAAQGATLTVLGHTDQGGGWYQVKGATVTGYVTDDPKLSAEGKFTAYSSSPLGFSALYPENWTSTESPPSSVVFHPPSGADSIVVTVGPTISKLGRGRSGYHQDSSETVVVCGVTGALVTLSQAATSPLAGATTSPPAGATTTTVAAGVAPERYLLQVRLALDSQHALGVDANLADLAQAQLVKSVMYSITFPFPQCQQGATPETSSTAPATTVH